MTLDLAMTSQLGCDSQSADSKRKKKKRHYNQIKKFCASKDTINRVKRAGMMGDYNLHVVYLIFDKELISDI